MPNTYTPVEIETRILDAIASLGPDRSQVTRAATFESLDIDSLDLVELAQIFEEEFGVRLEIGDFKDVTQVGHAIDVIVVRADE
jgi:acyl carrier protein